MTMNPVFHGWTKHIELDYHYVRERVALDALETCFVPSKHQLANIFTKPLSKALFLDLRLKLGLVFDPCHSLRGSESITDTEFTTKSTSADLERYWYGSYCRICSNRFGKLLNQLFSASYLPQFQPLTMEYNSYCVLNSHWFSMTACISPTDSACISPIYVNTKSLSNSSWGRVSQFVFRLEE